MTDDIRSADTTPEEDAWLESLLRNEAVGQPYLDDDGFTQRLMAALPPPRQRRSRRWIIWIMAVLGVLVGGIGLHGIDMLSQDLSRLAGGESVPLSQAISLLVAIGVFYWLTLELSLE